MSAEPATSPRAFASAVLQAFEEAGRYSDAEVHSAGGPSSTTMTKYRKVAAGIETMVEPRGDTYRAIDKAANWVSGSARALWRTASKPVVLLPGVPPNQSARWRRIIEESDLDEAKRAELTEAIQRALDTA